MSLNRFNPSKYPISEASPRFPSKNAEHQSTTTVKTESRIVDLPSDTTYPSPTLLNKLQNSNFLRQFSRTRLAVGGKLKILLQVLLFLWLLNSLVEKFQFTDNDDSRFQHLRNQNCKQGSFEDLCQFPNSYKKIYLGVCGFVGI
jgi:hypothetical protein